MKKNLLKLSLIITTVFLSPVVALAAVGDCAEIPGLGRALCQLNEILSSALPLLIGLAVVYFIWGVIQYFIFDTEEAKKKGRDRVIYGIIGLVVIIGFWGLVFIVTDTFGLSTNGSGFKKAPDFTTLVTTPTVSSECKMGKTFQGVLDYGTCIIGKSIIPFIFALAVLMFIWGAVKFFILNADEEAKRAQGKQFMLWGIIALTVMIGVWGLVGILQTTFGIKTGASVLPQVKPNK